MHCEMGGDIVGMHGMARGRMEVRIGLENKQINFKMVKLSPQLHQRCRAGSPGRGCTTSIRGGTVPVSPSYIGVGAKLHAYYVGWRHFGSFCTECPPSV